MVNTQAFVDHVFFLSPDGGLANCPCNKCQNCSRQVKIDMERHLCKWGFMPNYERWYEHGESQEREPYNLVDSFEENEDRMDAMMDDFVQQVENAAEVPEYFGLLASSKELLHGATTLSQLAAVTRLMAIKSKYNFSVSCYNDLVDLILDMLPKPHKFPKDFYYSKKLLAGLGMPYQKIHVCENNCMLFWKNYENLNYCSFCKKCRYKKVVKKHGRFSMLNGVIDTNGALSEAKCSQSTQNSRGYQRESKRESLLQEEIRQHREAMQRQEEWARQQHE
jgi:hypothetical protein